ncbi:MAG: M24 family metallopeptidase [Amaricoccus sp.]|uniref:M24 family metallopeptidase n=1 Tax=Amaricoccus sp. TaxID=1872485 RepID=UPI0039E4199B
MFNTFPARGNMMNMIGAGGDPQPCHGQARRMDGEYKIRQSRFAAALREMGLAGAVVLSRGGATLDRYGDVLYLSGFYQSYSYMPETPGLFTGRAHAALVINATGESRLCPAVAEFAPGSVLAGGIVRIGTFAESVARAMAELGIPAQGAGLVGGDVLTWQMQGLLAERMPGLSWRPCDEALHRLRRSKSTAEFAAIRRAAQLHVTAVQAMKAAMVPGCTEAGLIATFADVVLRGGGGVYFAVMSSGPGIDRLASHPAPGFSTRQIAAGEMMRFDTGIVLDGYLSDFGRTWVMGPPSAPQARLLDVLHAALDRAIAAASPGATIADIARSGDAALVESGVVDSDAGPGSLYSGFPVHWGHGLGMGWERPWITADETMPITPGMYLAIERTITLSCTGTASAEQTLLVHDGHVEILTEGVNGRWH